VAVVVVLAVAVKLFIPPLVSISTKALVQPLAAAAVVVLVFRLAALAARLAITSSLMAVLLTATL
jgi:hypothetical protein